MPPSPPIEQGSLKTTPQDRAAGMVMASLMLVGFLVLILFLIWLTRAVISSRSTVEVEVLGDVERVDVRLGGGGDFADPGIEASELTSPSPAEMLSSLSDVISSQTAAIEAAPQDQLLGGGGAGSGDGRSVGPGADKIDDVTPPWERWEIRYASNDLTKYAAQLDFFGIELAAAGGGKAGIDYAFHLSKNPPERRSGFSEEESRIYLIWKSGGLRATDIALLRRAKIDTDGRVVMQFLPPRVEQNLLALEKAEAGGRSTAQIAKTVFAVEPAEGGYQFLVVEQAYR